VVNEDVGWRLRKKTHEHYDAGFIIMGDIIDASRNDAPSTRGSCAYGRCRVQRVDGSEMAERRAAAAENLTGQDGVSVSSPAGGGTYWTRIVNIEFIDQDVKDGMSEAIRQGVD
jgi:hypothetical protein